MQLATVISIIKPYMTPLDPTFDTITASPFIAMQQLFKYHKLLAIQAKTTHSINLAVQMKGPNLNHIPMQFCQYHNVFSEQALKHLP